MPKIIDKFFGRLDMQTTEKDITGVSANNDLERKFLCQIINDQDNAESVKTGTIDELESIEQTWEDEYKIMKGGGLQWDTSFAYRTKKDRKFRPNSEDNFVFNSIMQLHANMTVSTPEVTIEGSNDNIKDIAEKITFMSRFNDKRNNWRAIWKKLTLDFIAYGPVIGMVAWDPDWMGGVGPERWIGDVRIIRINRKEFYPDPSIIELEERLQECRYINRKVRKTLSYIKKRWKDKGKYVAEETNDDNLQDEGGDPQQAYVIEYWHKGKPKWIDESRKKELLAKADELEQEGDTYKAQDYRDMAEGNIDGVHVAYVSNNVFLEYIPYVYDDGLYPFIYKTCYYDENNQWGYGEIRNIKIPQAMHNKADEIEIEAMSRQGLGGMYYPTGAITPRQLDTIKKNSGKGGAWLEVTNTAQLKEREGAQVPASVVNYKEHKQRMIETISQVTPIQQGMAPGANMPYKAIAELGARTDVRLKGKTEILEDFLTELNRLRINRFAQFYTEDRYYRIKGSDNKTREGTFNAKEMFLEWVRDTEIDELGQAVERKEKFIPEFDINVKIMDEKPTDRNYYTQTAFNLFGIQGITMEDLWYVLEEGKFPPKDEVLKHLENQNTVMQLTANINQMQPELQQQFFIQLQQILQNMQMQQQQVIPQEQEMQETQYMQGGDYLG